MVPEPLERKCPKCGGMIEIWSDEEKTDCTCGETVFKDAAPTCII
jgi:phage FluMu protein Com